MDSMEPEFEKVWMGLWRVHMIVMPIFALVTWGYRQGTHPPAYYLKQMGLWDLDSELKRVSTPLVSHFRDLTDGGCNAVGFLKEVQHVS
jgi:hypothetical protein